MRIWDDTAKLIIYDLSMAEVNQAISEQNILISAGILGSPPNPDSQLVAAPIVANGQLKDPEEFGNIVLRAYPDGSSVRIKDVARVEVGADNYQFGARLNGQPTAAFAISLAPEANALSTAKGVEEMMDELAECLPEGGRDSLPYASRP